MLVAACNPELATTCNPVLVAACNPTIDFKIKKAKVGGKVLPVGTPRGPYEVALRLSPVRSPSVSRLRRMIAGMITIGFKIKKAELGG